MCAGSSPPRVAPQPYIRSHPPCVIKPYRFVWPSCSTSRGGPRERLSSAHHPASRSGRGARGLSRRPYIYFVVLLLSFRSARALSHARCVEPYGSHSAATRSTVRLPTRPRRHLPCLSRAYVYPSTWVGLHSWHSSVEPTVQLAPHQSLHSSTPSYPAQPLLTLLTLRSESIPYAHGGSNHHTLLTRREKFSPIRIGRSEGTTTAGRSSSLALPAPPSPAPSSSAGAGASSSFASFFGSG